MEVTTQTDRRARVAGRIAVLIFCFGGGRGGRGEDVEEDGENVANKQTSRAEGYQGLDRSEAQPVTKRQRDRKS
jgi:hypothetical protein